MKNTGLILEGGGTRGVFTSGILDFFLDKELRFPYVVGVSAGACNGISYISLQKERTRRCTIDCIGENDYLRIRNLFTKGSIFDMDLLFDKFPNQLIPFDYEAYFKSEQRMLITTTNCLTGQPHYLEEQNNKERLMDICRASSSLPYLSPFVVVDRMPMLDGGISDSIPIRKSVADGNNKNVVILTRSEGYRKKNRRNTKLGMLKYKNYPQLNEAIYNRSVAYNETLDYIEALEAKGEVFVIRPKKEFLVGRTERNKNKLIQLYNHGYHQAERVHDELLSWLSK